MKQAARAHGQHKNRDREFDDRDHAKEPAAQRQGLHRLGFDNASQQLAHSLMTDAIRLQSQRAAK